MGAIKDVVDLTRELATSVKDRHIAGELLNIQRLILDIQSENAGIQEKSIALKTENAELKQQNASLQQELVALRNKPEETAVQSELSEGEVAVLVFLASHNKAPANAISHTLGQNATKVEFWLDRLCDLNLIGNTLNLNGPNKYFLIELGREYLVTNDLV